jgi:hypothetical protein
MKRSWFPQIASSIFLILALNPDNPYGYYLLLRVVCCACFAFLTFRYFQAKQTGWVWLFAVLAVIYNPFIRVHLNRELWSVINVVTVAIAAVSIFTIKPRANGNP